MCCCWPHLLTGSFQHFDLPPPRSEALPEKPLCGSVQFRQSTTPTGTEHVRSRTQQSVRTQLLKSITAPCSNVPMLHMRWLVKTTGWFCFYLGYYNKRGVNTKADRTFSTLFGEYCESHVLLSFHFTIRHYFVLLCHMKSYLQRCICSSNKWIRSRFINTFTRHWNVSRAEMIYLIHHDKSFIEIIVN